MQVKRAKPSASACVSTTVKVSQCSSPSGFDLLSLSLPIAKIEVAITSAGPKQKEEKEMTKPPVVGGCSHLSLSLSAHS